MIKTGMKFFEQSIMIESTGIPEVDEAIKTVFKDDYRKTAPLRIARDDVQVVLAWMQSNNSEPEPDEQLLLFNH